MIIATAGHVDHGKTSLVKTLTGIDTDRHPEEKRRGLTIDIGFAYMQTDTDQSIAIIDVPGHEKFVRNMISGVGLVDIALLVVAADDGPMPQTIEHIAILQLMNVKMIVPVISKTDLVDSERQAQVVAELSDLLKQSSIAASDFVCLSVLDSKAVLTLREKLFELIRSLPPREVRGHFRMAIDRCFTIDGSGTVVTGTVSSGRLEKNQSLSLVSDSTTQGKVARARGLHTQNAEAVTASAGQRCAVNLSGDIAREDLRRGAWLTANPSSVRTTIIDVVLTAALSPVVHEHDRVSPTVHHWTPAHLHLGTADIPCRIALLDCTEMKRGETVLARLICERAFTAAHGDRFVLRDQSARATIAGGRVLDVLPPRRGRSKPERLRQLSALNVESSSEALSNLLAINPYGVSVDEFALRFNLLATETDSLIKNNDLVLIASGLRQWCLTRSQSTSVAELLLTTLQAHHREHPDQPGVGQEIIHRAIGRELKPEVLEYHLQTLIKQNKVVRTASVFRHAEHQIAMNQSDTEMWVKVERELTQAELTPPRVVELADVIEKDIEETRLFLNHCVAHGKIFKVTDNRYFLPQTLRDLAIVAESLSAANKLTVAEFRNQSGVGRNLVVELLEYFDRCRFTQRVANNRVVLTPAADVF